MKYVNPRLRKNLNKINTIEINASNYADHMNLLIKMNHNKADIKSINFNTKDKLYKLYRSNASRGRSKERILKPFNQKAKFVGETDQRILIFLLNIIYCRL